MPQKVATTRAAKRPVLQENLTPVKTKRSHAKFRSRINHVNSTTDFLAFQVPNTYTLYFPDSKLETTYRVRSRSARTRITHLRNACAYPVIVGQCFDEMAR